MKVLLLGHMGRDEALAERLVGHELHIMGLWANPGLKDKSEASGGAFYVIKSITDTTEVVKIAKELKPDMFITNFDDSLAAGMVDAVQAALPQTLIPCPEKAAARVEWDKFYLRELVDKIDPSFNPENFMVESPEAAAKAVDHFKSKGMEMALKPRNLTGGKGVKVQGKHFDTHQDGLNYAKDVLSADNQSGIEVQEKLGGHEFTLQLFTDGTTLVEPPATYDYPYREDGDTGPGTGGMGTFSQADGLMPFVTAKDKAQSIELISKLLKSLKVEGASYKGVIYPTFFKTSQGLKIVEINARGGDPELINILDLMSDDTDMYEVLTAIAKGELRGDSIKYQKLASALVYLVSPDYGYKKSDNIEFELDSATVKKLGCKLRFAAAERVAGDLYRTTSTSRIVALSALGKTPWDAQSAILKAIEAGFKRPLSLHFRHDVADQDYIESLSK